MKGGSVFFLILRALNANREMKVSWLYWKIGRQSYKIPAVNYQGIL